MLDTGAVYSRQRADITELLSGLTAQEQLAPVPGCPGWRVRDLVSHLAGLPADIVAGRVEGAGTDPWTAAQVEERQDRTLDELLAEWAEHAPFVEEHATSWGPAFQRIGYDITLHGDDLREALGLPMGTTPDHATVLDGLLAGASGRIAAAALPALRVVTPTRDLVLGAGQPGATVTMPDDGELGRAVGGRRSSAQLAALQWDGDPSAYLPLLPLFGPRD